MLFRTVYGQELESIYVYLQQRTAPVSKLEVINTFLPISTTKSLSTQNIEDAISFLVSSGLVTEKNNFLESIPTNKPFKLALLNNLRNLQTKGLDSSHPTDALFFTLLDELFTKPNLVVLDKLHSKANQLKCVKEVGGLSQEKVQAWKRVLEFLGLGLRVQSGFYAHLSLELLLMMLEEIQPYRMSLQEFFEDYLTSFIPCLNSTQDVSSWVAHSLIKLEQSHKIQLATLQDSPMKAYFMPQKFKLISYNGVQNA
jgi:hypothetical protein